MAVPALKATSFECVQVSDIESDLSPGGGVGNADWLVVDHYRLGAAFEARSRSRARRIAVISDFPDRDHDCDLLIDQTIGRSPSDYAGLVRLNGTILAGGKYVLLAPPFASKRAEALARRRLGLPADHLVISLGATDPENVTSWVLNDLRQCGWLRHLTVLLSPSAPHLSAVQRDLASNFADGNLVVGASPSEVAALYSEADIAVGASGVSAYERCCLGLPTIMLVLADNQRDISAGLARAGAVENLGVPKHLHAGAIANAIRNLTEDAAHLKMMTEHAWNVCDGLGAQRVVGLMEQGM